MVFRARPEAGGFADKGVLEPAGTEPGPTKTLCLANDIAQSVGPASAPAMYGTISIREAK
jgi:hypothetical protein